MSRRQVESELSSVEPLLEEAQNGKLFVSSTKVMATYLRSSHPDWLTKRECSVILSGLETDLKQYVRSGGTYSIICLFWHA